LLDKIPEPPLTVNPEAAEAAAIRAIVAYSSQAPTTSGAPNTAPTPSLAPSPVDHLADHEVRAKAHLQTTAPAASAPAHQATHQGLGGNAVATISHGRVQRASLTLALVLHGQVEPARREDIIGFLEK